MSGQQEVQSLQHLRTRRVEPVGVVRPPPIDEFNKLDELEKGLYLGPDVESDWPVAHLLARLLDIVLWLALGALGAKGLTVGWDAFFVAASHFLVFRALDAEHRIQNWVSELGYFKSRQL